MNKRQLFPFLIPIVIVIFLMAGFVFWVLPGMVANGVDNNETQIGISEDAVKAEVIEVLEEGEIQLGDVSQQYQELRVEVLEGEFRGLQLDIDYGRRQIRPAGLNLSPGDRVIVQISRNQENLIQARFVDFVRIRPLLVLFSTFILFSVIISGWKGVRGLLGMGVSIAVIIFYIIPQILQGRDPVLVTVSGAFFLLAVSLYLIYGWTLKTHAAVVGTLVSLMITAFLATIFVDLTRLTGFGSEDALFLIQQSEVTINMQGLVLGGMLIGALGVLDDLVITQASVVFELYVLNPELRLKDLYQRAMRVGQDHVAATVNTLVLAYTGAALPMFLLFYLSGEQIGDLLNLEFVAEEVVRTMVGSLGLISAVPLTTLLACLIVKNYADIESEKNKLGSSHGGHAHGIDHKH